MDKIYHPVQIIRDHHKKWAGLSQQVKAAPARASEMTEGVIKELLMELDVDFQMKRKYFYPDIKNHLTDTESALLIENSLRNIEENSVTLESLAKHTTSNPETLSRINEFITQVQETYDAEERDVYVRAQKTPEEALKHTALKMMQEQHKIYSLEKYRDALPSKVQNPNGGEQMRKIS